MTFQSANKAYGSSNREAKGFLFLLLILITPFLVQYTYRSLFYKSKESALSITYLSDTCEGKKEFKQYANSYIKSDQTVISSTAALKRKQTNIHIELNTADSVTLESLPGIGPAFASRIIKYRNLLGGYVRAEQLKEVYGMPEETYERIKPLCTINTVKVKMIKADSLWINPYKFYHPYLSKELKGEIIQEKKKTTYSEEALKRFIYARNAKLEWYILW